MRIGIGLTLATSVLLALQTAAAQDANDLIIELPASESWTLISEQVAGDAYSREWILEGRSYENTEWLIAQQKIPVESDISAADFMEEIHEMTEGACTSASHEGPDRLRISGHRAAVGRTVCAQRKGEKFGAFSDRVVLVDGGFAHVITSELRIPPMLVEGIVSFRNSELDTTPEEFRSRDAMSKVLVKESIRIADD